MRPNLSSPFEVFSPASDLIATLILGSGALMLLSVCFAAFALGSHVWSRYQTRVWKRQKEDWDAQIVTVLAGDLRPQTLTDTVPKKYYGSFLEALMPYATVVDGAEKQIIQALAAPFLPRVKANLSSRRSLVRARAVQRLGLLGGPEQAAALRQMLDDSSPRVVERTVHSLARVGGAADAERLLDCLPRLAHVDPRHLSSSLVHLGEAAAPTMRAAMADDERPPFVRICCAETLRELRDTASVAAAAWLLEDAKFRDMLQFPKVTASLLRLLKHLGKGVHGPLIRAYCHAPASFVRLHAARALGQLGTPEDEVLLGALVYGDESRWVALGAARSLIEIGSITPLRKLRTLDHPRAALASDLLLSFDQ